MKAILLVVLESRLVFVLLDPKAEFDNFKHTTLSQRIQHIMIILRTAFGKFKIIV